MSAGRSEAEIIDSVNANLAATPYDAEADPLCIFCVVPEIDRTKIPVWAINIPVVETSPIYMRYKYMSNSELTHEEFRSSTRFTPGARTKMDINEAAKLLTHYRVWEEVMNAQDPICLVMSKDSDLKNAELTRKLESVKPPKDWDILIISDDQYVIRTRGARILYNSAGQFHLPLNTYIKSFEVLKVVQLNNTLTE